MSELQDLYESINPIPENLSRCGDGYCQHVYMLIDPYASGYKARFEGFKHGLQHQQSKVDELKLQVAEMKSRLNDAYTDGQSAMYTARQTKVDEAEAKAQMCRDEKNHAINRWSAVCKERDELQKRVDAAIYLLPSIKAENDLWGCDQVARQIELLEQALKDGIK